LVIEIDYGTTQEYKKRRVEAALGGMPANVVYAPIDFARESLGEVLGRAGFQPGRKTYYLCEGVSMYVPEEGMKETCARSLRNPLPAVRCCSSISTGAGSNYSQNIRWG
jgi:O-methyltransferase involved in polyketide biosynthesis